MLRREVPEAREILRNLIVGQIVFTPRPEARVYELSGQGRSGGFWPEHQSSFGGDPGGIRTRDLDLERVASLARLDDGVQASSVWRKREGMITERPGVLNRDAGSRPGGD
jgi:hypothetical protein